MNLLESLLAARPLTPDRSDAVADELGLRRGAVAEAASSYAYLREDPRATRFCTGPLCTALGRCNGDVAAPCLGHCDLAPMRLRGDRLDGELLHHANDGPSTGLVKRDETLADYVARGGMSAYALDLPSARVLADLEASGLVGCGGAGFPTHRKWRAVREQPGPRTVVVNADEGEPGTFKDRYLMELRPHLVLEGVLIALRFCETDRATIYVREEYGEAQRRLRAAVAELGAPVDVVSGAGSYVCGEETALLESLEGKRGMPRLRPPFPAERGLNGMPTLVNNVETLAHVPAILLRGGELWPKVRLWSVSGCVAEPGCYEAPLGVTVRELIERYAGGATDEIGAIVPGGAASGILPPSALDVPLTREALRPWHADVGSAAVQVFPASFPIRDLLVETLRFFAEESCQKCTPCRIGTRALLAYARGERTFTRKQRDRWLVTMERDSLCGLGQAAPLPLRSVLAHWPEVFA